MKLPGVSMQSALSTAALVLASVFAAPSAMAASYCGASLSNADDLSKSDMSFDSMAASDCYGVSSGNDDALTINTLANWADPDPALTWALLAKSDTGNNSGSLSGIDFTLTASTGTAGTWTLEAFDSNGPSYANLPATMDFVGVLKASNGFAAYWFDDVTVSAGNAGTWTIAFVNKGGKTPDLSHLSLYTRIDGSGGIPAAIPEARTYAMMLVGLGLVGFMARRARIIV
ncbi:MAG: PEP-CTERM sorting domain-containing protein [Gammaproteobacteria bacterium]|nr:PEP-CTERM sorting domain-containing protein [Gammaproteobacteria bacterium]